MLFSTVLEANDPLADDVLRLTVSPLITPDSVADVVVKVAEVFPSKIFVEAVMPVTVRFFAVMLAVVLG